jgi:hypothetical protein
MNGKPDRFSLRIGPLDAVAAMPGDEDVVAGLESYLPAVEKAKGCASFHQQDPLIRLLVIPEAGGRRLALGDDPLDPEGFPPEELRKDLFRHLTGNIKQVADLDHFSSSHRKEPQGDEYGNPVDDSTASPDSARPNPADDSDELS